ncbi:hypothetical protein LCGC14_2974400, partial [marine sediment metagenome]
FEGGKNIIRRYGVTPEWNSKNKAPWFLYIDEIENQYALNYENHESLKAKLEVVQTEEIGGISIWRLGSEDPDNYKVIVGAVAKACFRILKDNAWLLFWYSVEDWHKETRAILEIEGFTVCPMPAVWVHDSNYTATPAYRLGQRTENFFYARKGIPKLGKMGHGNTFTFRTAKKNERFHIAEKPIELYEDILKVFLGNRKGTTTISGFAGSGNFILAADNLSHNSIGFDLSKDFKNNYIAKVTAEAPGQYKTYKD